MIEVANSRNSNIELVEVENKNIEISKKNAEHLLMHGTLSEQKKFIQNQNIKIRQNPLEEVSESDTSSNSK